MTLRLRSTHGRWRGSSIDSFCRRASDLGARPGHGALPRSELHRGRGDGTPDESGTTDLIQPTDGPVNAAELLVQALEGLRLHFLDIGDVGQKALELRVALP